MLSDLMQCMMMILYGPSLIDVVRLVTSFKYNNRMLRLLRMLQSTRRLHNCILLGVRFVEVVNTIFETLAVTPKQTALCAEDKILIISNLK